MSLLHFTCVVLSICGAILIFNWIMRDEKKSIMDDSTRLFVVNRDGTGVLEPFDENDLEEYDEPSYNPLDSHEEMLGGE